MLYCWKWIFVCSLHFSILHDILTFIRFFFVLKFLIQVLSNLLWVEGCTGTFQLKKEKGNFRKKKKQTGKSLTYLRKWLRWALLQLSKLRGWEGMLGQLAKYQFSVRHLTKCPGFLTDYSNNRFSYLKFHSVFFKCNTFILSFTISEDS